MFGLNDGTVSIGGKGQLKGVAKEITTNHWFEIGITLIILVNSFLIGVETYTSSSALMLVQNVILYIFSMEIILRFIAPQTFRRIYSMRS